ncbi:hypothetical protein BC628DRAFT_946033 [Trametes gibbosa]|nr:hypothetical protein BC628DRAFT_946033 [Trametes gibbosa]
MNGLGGQRCEGTARASPQRLDRCGRWTGWRRMERRGEQETRTSRKCGPVPAENGRSRRPSPTTADQMTPAMCSGLPAFSSASSKRAVRSTPASSRVLRVRQPHTSHSLAIHLLVRYLVLLCQRLFSNIARHSMISLSPRPSAQLADIVAVPVS